MGNGTVLEDYPPISTRNEHVTVLLPIVGNEVIWICNDDMSISNQSVIFESLYGRTVNLKDNRWQNDLR